MANSNKKSNDEGRSVNTAIHPQTGKRWTLLYIGNHGRTITLKRFKGMVMLTCLVLCISIAINGGLLYLSLNIRSEKNRLDSNLNDLKAQIKDLRYEKDVLLTKLVLAESRSKQSALKKTPQASESAIPQHESVVDDKTVQSTPTAAIQKKPPVAKVPEPPPTDSRADTGQPSVAIDNFKIFLETDKNLLRVQFKIKNTSPDDRRVAGHTIVVLKGEQLRQNQWLTIPRISLSNGKPTGRQRGYSFGINNFKTMRFKTNLPKSPEIYREATVFTFSQKGDLLLEQNFPVNLPALPAAAASKPPLKTPAAPSQVSSTRAFSGAPATSSTKPHATSSDTSPAPSAATPPSTDELMNALKDTTEE